MADNAKKVSELPTASNVASTDRVLVLRNPAGSASVRTVTLNNFTDSIRTSNTTAAGVIKVGNNLSVNATGFLNVDVANSINIGTFSINTTSAEMNFNTSSLQAGNTINTNTGFKWFAGTHELSKLERSGYLVINKIRSYVTSNLEINSGNLLINPWIFADSGILHIPSGVGDIHRDGVSVLSSIPQNFTNTSLTLALTDAGKHILTQNNGSSQIITVPSSSSVSYSIGAEITIVVQSTGTVTVANGAGVTMYLAGNSVSKSTIALNSYSVAKLLKIGTDTWIVSGTGVS